MPKVATAKIKTYWWVMLAVAVAAGAFLSVWALVNQQKPAEKPTSNETAQAQPKKNTEQTSEAPPAPETNDNAGNGSAPRTGGGQSTNTGTSSSEVIAVPASTLELRAGQPLEQFPFPIMTDPPHVPHNPVTDFASVVNNPDGSFVFTLPDTTSDDGLYGRFWLSPTLPAPNAKLVGVRFNNPAWSGTATNTIVVFSLLDRVSEDNALGSVTGATQGLAGQLVGVLFDTSSPKIELRFNTPVENSFERFVAVIDSENLPTDTGPFVFPDQISVSGIEWLWTAN